MERRSIRDGSGANRRWLQHHVLPRALQHHGIFRQHAIAARSSACQYRRYRMKENRRLHCESCIINVRSSPSTIPDTPHRRRSRTKRSLLHRKVTTVMVPRPFGGGSRIYFIGGNFFESAEIRTSANRVARGKRFVRISFRTVRLNCVS